MFKFKINGVSLSNINGLIRYTNIEDAQEKLFDYLNKSVKPKMYNDILGAVLTRPIVSGRTRDFTAAHFFYNKEKKKITIRFGVLLDKKAKRSPYYINFLEDGTEQRSTKGKIRRYLRKRLSSTERQRLRRSKQFNRGRITANPIVWGASYRWSKRLNEIIASKLNEIIGK